MIGLSGGPDSLAMTLLFGELQKKYDLFLIVAHVNYHLRGAESDLDESFVKKFCYKYNLPLYILQANIKEDKGIQQQARIIRLDYFHKLKKHYKMDYIALGHHKDDQAETVLHRILRGSGFTGLAGIYPNKNGIIHPLLDFSKEQILDFLEQKEIEFCVDKTNLTSNYTRNKIRNELLPLIKNDFNPNFEQKLIEYGNLFHLAENYFVKQTKKDFKKALITRTESEIYLDLEVIKDSFEILNYYIFKEAWSILSGDDKDFYSIHFQDIMEIVNSDSGFKEIHLPENIVVMKDCQHLIFRRGDIFKPLEKEKYKVLADFRKSFSFNEYRFTLSKSKSLGDLQLKTDSNCQIVIDLDKVVFPITFRYRSDGDRFIPFGRNSFKKLKDYFIDEKVSMLEKDNIVILADAEKIIWVSGYRLDNRVAVSDETKNFLHVKYENTDENKNRSAERKIRIRRGQRVEQ